MIALTGGAGFLGYHVVNYFHDQDDCVAALLGDVLGEGPEDGPPSVSA